MNTGHDDHEHPRATELTLSVAELLDRVAAERGLNFEPTPPAVSAALPELVATVERVMQRLRDGQEWRWLAAALAALSHRVQEDALLLDLDDNEDADGLS